MPGIAAVILAAGSSSRLGKPKQLLRFRGRALIRQAAEETLAAGCGPVVVVLGASIEPMVRELAPLPVHVVENRECAGGMGASIPAGIGGLMALGDAAEPEAVVLAVCDQPHFSAGIVQQLIKVYRESGGLVASRYGEGVPALFPRALFPALLERRGDQGARALIRAHAAAVRSVPFPEGAIDIDTAADYDLLDPR